MKTCPYCGESIEDNSAQCFKCGTHLKTSAYQKICPKCKQIYRADQDYCKNCPDTLLSVYMPDAASEKGSAAWMYVVGFLFPLIGIILGIVYIARKEDALGKSLLLFSIFAPMAAGVVLGILTGLF
ncbi:MAG TPA: zinc ribbon domain-containing protein [Candidatus Avimonoglobus intestinipullorum]|uniref:Zinc ribbon domain-containing protein n=1 Tax=Candidatus Avimonoglobus intestinipullorum TaxID=2840699 RepID=A0A9D1S7I9_9FIRM|nr:zinc ribbon domain-containing protein [Candidatus Avimonoglobus intestinipullorum]